MTSIKPTTSNQGAGTREWDALPEGTYNAEVARITYKPIDLDRTPWLNRLVDRGVKAQISFGFRITSGPFAKRWVWGDIPAEISDHSACKLRLYLQEILQENTLPSDFSFDEADYDDYIGLPCRVRLGKYFSEKAGVERNSLDDVLSPTAKQLNEASGRTHIKSTPSVKSAPKEEWEPF